MHCDSSILRCRRLLTIQAAVLRSIWRAALRMGRWGHKRHVLTAMPSVLDRHMTCRVGRVIWMALHDRGEPVHRIGRMMTTAHGAIARNGLEIVAARRVSNG